MPDSLAATRRKAIVTAVNTDGTVTIQVGGDDQTDYDAFYTDGYQPVVGDIVVVLASGGQHYVLGTTFGPPGRVSFRNMSTLLIAASTAGSYVTNTNTTSGNFVKARDNTRIEFEAHWSMFTLTATGTGVQWGVRTNVVSGPGTAGDTDILGMVINPAGQHTPFSGFAYISGMPAGTYTFSMRFFRTSGTGSINQDSGDFLIYKATEVA